MKTAGSRPVEILVNPPFDDDDVYLCQGKFGGKHQPGRTASSDQYGMVLRSHRASPLSELSIAALLAGGLFLTWSSVRFDDGGGRGGETLGVIVRSKHADGCPGSIHQKQQLVA